MDGVTDILICNGGDANASKSDSVRPVGKLLVVSGSNGQVIAQLDMPDGKETYFSPLLLKVRTERHILFGSGGESVGGSLWLLPVSSLLREDTTGLIRLKINSEKGFIAAPSVVDLNKDGIEDILASDMEGTITAWSGENLNILWDFIIEDAEGYVSPSLGFFNSDSIPDIHTTFSYGEFPFYSGHNQVILDGKTGREIWSSDSGLYPLTSPIIMDKDEDGLDELLRPFNYDAGFAKVEYRSKLQWMNLDKKTIVDATVTKSGFILYATPYAADLDRNNKLDILPTTNRNENNWYKHDSFTMTRYEMESMPNVSWPGYLGYKGTGRMKLDEKTTLVPYVTDKNFKVFPNPTGNILYWKDESYKIYKVTNLLGECMDYNASKGKVDLLNFKSGLYLITFSSNDMVITRKVTVIR